MPIYPIYRYTISPYDQDGGNWEYFQTAFCEGNIVIFINLRLSIRRVCGASMDFGRWIRGGLGGWAFTATMKILMIFYQYAPS